MSKSFENYEDAICKSVNNSNNPVTQMRINGLQAMSTKEKMDLLKKIAGKKIGHCP